MQSRPRERSVQPLEPSSKVPPLAPASPILSPDEAFREFSRNALDRAFREVCPTAPKGAGQQLGTPAEGLMGIASIVLVAAPAITSCVALRGELEESCVELLQNLPALLDYHGPRWPTVLELWSQPSIRRHKGYLCEQLGQASQSILLALHQQERDPKLATVLSAPRTALALLQWDAFTRFGRTHVEELTQIAAFARQPDFSPLVREWVKQLTAAFTRWLEIRASDALDAPENFETFRVKLTALGGVEAYCKACSSAFHAVFGCIDSGRKPGHAGVFKESQQQRIARTLLWGGRLGSEDLPGFDPGAAYKACVDVLTAAGIRADRFEVLLSRCHPDEVTNLLRSAVRNREILHHTARCITQDGKAEEEAVCGLITGVLAACRLWGGEVPRPVMKALEKTPTVEILLRFFDVVNHRNVREPNDVERLIDLVCEGGEERRAASQVLIALAEAGGVTDDVFWAAVSFLGNTRPTDVGARAAEEKFGPTVAYFTPWLRLAEGLDSQQGKHHHSPEWSEKIRRATRGVMDASVSKGARLLLQLDRHDELLSLVQRVSEKGRAEIHQMARCVGGLEAIPNLRKIWQRALQSGCDDAILHAVIAHDDSSVRVDLIEALDPQKRINLAEFVAGVARSQ
jgi:hypothetical protein